MVNTWSYWIALFLSRILPRLPVEEQRDMATLSRTCHTETSLIPELWTVNALNSPNKELRAFKGLEWSQVSWSISTSNLHWHFITDTILTNSRIFHHSDLLYIVLTTFTSCYNLLESADRRQALRKLDLCHRLVGPDQVTTIFQPPIFRCYVASSIILCVDTCSSQCYDIHIMYLSIYIYVILFTVHNIRLYVSIYQHW